MSLYKKYEDAAITALGAGNYDEAIHFLTSIPDSERSGEADVFLATAKMQAEDYSGEDEFYKLAELAASKGEYKVYEILGQMFANGHFSGLKESDKANECFKIGAEHGNVVCMNYYAMHLDQSGKLKESVDWFTKAAELGHPTSQFNLALRYENGKGVKKDIDKAIYWYEKAAENGDEDAPEAIESLKKKKAVIESGVLTQEEIDGGFEITGEDDRKLSLPEKQNAIKKYKTITKSPVDIMGYYYVDEQFFKDVEAAEAGDEALIARYIGSSLKHLGDEQYANQNELLMYWLGKALEYKASDALAIAFLKLKDSDCLAKEMYDAAVIIKGNPSTIVPFASMMVDSWLKTHKPPRKTSKKSNTNQITKKQDRIEIFDQDTISLFSQHLALEGTSPCSVRYEDITMLEFTSNGFCMVLRIYSEGVDGKVFICADNKDSDRLHDVLKDLVERLPDKDSVEIIDNNNTTPDESTQIIASAFADALKETLGQNFQSIQEYDAVFEWLDLDSDEDFTGYVEGKVDLNKKDEQNGSYSFKLKLTFDHEISDDDLPSLNIYDTEAELSNSFEETIGMNEFQIPSSYISETHTKATWLASLYEEENEYRVMVYAKIERSYTEFEWSANLTCENIERVDSDSIIISFKVECTDPVSKNWDDDDDAEMDDESESFWETDDDFEIEDENSESSSDNSVQNYTAYQEGKQHYISRRYADALKAFERVESDYLDVASLRAECRIKLEEEKSNSNAYDSGKSLYESGKYQEALTAWAILSDTYRDVKIMREKCRQQLSGMASVISSTSSTPSTFSTLTQKTSKASSNPKISKTTKIAIAVGVVLTIIAIIIFAVIHANSDESLYDWQELPDGTIQINGIEDGKAEKLIKDGVLTIPSEIDGKKVTVISGNSYSKNDYEGATKIIVPEGVITIDEYAFANCHFESIIIPNTVRSIGSHAFDSCSSLKDISIPNSVISIEEYAFKDCEKLNNIVLPNALISIETATFIRCESLKSIKIPDTVTRVDVDAFYGCKALENITMGNGLTEIERNAFQQCDNLKGVYIKDLDSWCNIDFDYSGNPLAYAHNLYLNGELITELVIPEGVTEIPSFAFSCENITSVTIPDSVTSIGSSAFSGCTSLTSVTIPNSVTSIGSSAFSGCTSLTSVTIGDSVTSIGSSAFSGCSSLESIILPFVGGSKSTTSARSSTLFGYIFGTSSYTGGVATKQYYDSYSNATYYIPSSLKSVTVIGGNILYGAFSGCTSLTSVTIPNSVTSIGSSAFSGCTSLTSVTIPDSVTSIGYDAFSGCTSLKRITIPDSVTSIGGSAFADCTSLTSITLPFVGATKDGTNNTHFGYIFGASSYSYNDDCVPSSIKTVVITGATSIGYNAFADCTSLTSVIIPATMKTIDTNAFAGCTSLSYVMFVSPTGWKYRTYSYTYGESFYQIPESSLSSPSSAATLLKDTYDSYEWRKD